MGHILWNFPLQLPQYRFSFLQLCSSRFLNLANTLQSHPLRLVRTDAGLAALFHLPLFYFCFNAYTVRSPNIDKPQMKTEQPYLYRHLANQELPFRTLHIFLQSKLKDRLAWHSI